MTKVYTYDQLIDNLFDRAITFRREFVTLTGSVHAALFLSQAVYWSKRTSDKNGWFYKSQQEWEEETGLTRRNQETARKLLRATKFFHEQLAGCPAVLHFRLDKQALWEALNDLACMPESDIQDRPTSTNKSVDNHTNKSARIGHTIKETEMTTETTSKITSEITANSQKKFTSGINTNTKQPYTPAETFKSKSEAFNYVKNNYQILEAAKKTIAAKGWRAVDEVDIMGFVELFLNAKARLGDPRDEVINHFRNWLFREPVDKLSEYAATFRKSLHAQQRI